MVISRNRSRQLAPVDTKRLVVGPVLGLFAVLISLLLSVGLAGPAAVSAQTAPGPILWAGTNTFFGNGELFRVDPANGNATLVGPVTVGGAAVSLTGLAVHPTTLVLYGSTSDFSPAFPGSLIRIDKTTAEATLIGSFGLGGCGCPDTLHDITFRSDGTLFGSHSPSPFVPPEIYRVNVSTGATTLVGPVLVIPQGGMGLSFQPLLTPGTLFFTPEVDAGDMYILDPSTAAITGTVDLNGTGNLIEAMTTDAAGTTLLGVRFDFFAGTPPELVAISPVSGDVTARGNLPDGTDALALELLPSVSINDVVVVEGNGGAVNAVFTVSANPAPVQTLTVQAQTANNTATAGSDYTAAGSQTITFNPGDTSKTFIVSVLGDTQDEVDETFFVNLTSPTNAALADAQGLGTITDDDSTGLSINDVSVTEGNSGSTSATFTITLTPVSAQTVTVVASTAGGGSATTGSDFTGTSQTLTFNPGVTTQTFTVTVLGDTLAETNETFNVTLSAPLNSTIADGQGVGTIVDDDGTPTLSINDVTVTEGNSGTVAAVFTVSLGAATSQQVTVFARTGGGPASGGTTCGGSTDYVDRSETLVFAPGVLTQTFTVFVCGDVDPEPNETFLVNLSSPTNATISDAQGQGTIVNDEQAPEPDPEPRRLTAEQRQQVQRTNTSSLDDERTEGSVVALDLTHIPPRIQIANRDGLVWVELWFDAVEDASRIRVGDYLKVYGQKENELLFFAYEVDIERPR